ncbi:Alpha/Beta hydrolase protein [Cercophora newfieldiana]|uniref:Alpha/Beta hydrolase protein n=1 Tax=Cercophora newfieldiana TaxID=92897 RepID=A0AA40D129_9PEZI|nr:Alpha/Beta hydrolase protein [Cercophora newfieldiana]
MDVHDGQPRRYGSSSTSIQKHHGIEKVAIEFAQQAEKLSYLNPQNGHVDGAAIEAEFVTENDTVIVTADGNRLPSIPVDQAEKLNALKEQLEATVTSQDTIEPVDNAHHVLGSNVPHSRAGKGDQNSAEGSLKKSMPPSHTNPLFPPLPLYGPPSTLRDIQCLAFRVSSFFLSLAFLGVIILGALFTSLPPFFYYMWLKATLRDPDARRPFYEEEKRGKALRREEERKWKRHHADGDFQQDEEDNDVESEGYIPTEGGPDPIVCDVGYYARRVGLNVESYEVQTEDGFIIDLWHVYDPREYTPLPEEQRKHRGPETFQPSAKKPLKKDPKLKFPVLLMHGLLQSSGAYCVNDDSSLAFYLCKSGFDVWLGNNRCGFEPKHTLLTYSDPRMWCWNIRQMGVFDLPALTSRVLAETGFEKIGLVSHSQGTTQTFVALAKEQRPELGEKLTVFCALAPAAYAGPLVGKMYFKFMRVITPGMFRLMFGIHAFIPFMMTMHKLLHPRLYGWMGYKVFSFLFNWTDTRWDRALRDRMFQFAPVYVSAESMRWWLGRECFAKHKCILSTKEEWRAEEREDQQHQQQSTLSDVDRDMEGQAGVERSERKAEEKKHRRAKGSRAWYNHQVPPFALWVCGSDELVDGDKLSRRLERGREPHVKVVHRKVIDEYEHLDVIWAMDAVEKVFKEIREVLWKTCDVRDVCRVPRGCEDVPRWEGKVDGEEGGGKEEESEEESESS